MPQTDLQPDREDGAVAQSGDRCVGRGVESFRACALEKAWVVPLARLMRGRRISRTGFLCASPCRTKCASRLG